MKKTLFYIFIFLMNYNVGFGKEKITSVDELPPYTYTVSGKPSELVFSDEPFHAFAQEVKKNINRILENYEIEDKTTLKRLYSTLISIDLIDGKGESALDLIQKRRALEEKAADKFLSGLTSEALVTTWQETKTDDAEAIREIYMKNLKSAVEPLPWDVVQDQVERLKGTLEILSNNVMVGLIQSQVDPAVEKTGNFSSDVADQIVNARSFTVRIEPLKEVIVQVLSAYIDQHKVEKDDIWKERNIVLSDCKTENPVIIGIWDSGVDVSVFQDQMLINRKEIPDGKDNDGNGFIDDIYGIAFDLKEEKTPSLLYPLSEEQLKRLSDMKDQIKGLQDVQAAVDSKEAGELKKKMATMKPEEVKPFLEELMLFAIYTHGTHVTGITIEDNPYAQVVAARITFDHHIIPVPPTVEIAKKAAANYMSTVQYFKNRGVRVVNMSWGWTFREIEGILEANGIGETPEDRREKAKEIFDIYKTGLYAALKGAPEILFVIAAGNLDSDVAFDEVIPSNFDLPNMLSVGAVDQAGEETDFTSFGDQVQVYANGFEVESYLPGGDRIEFSGTSMAAPNVANLAGKLLALEPSLMPIDVISLIKNGVDKSDDGRLFLIHPKRTIEILKEIKK